jgi:hypothetical protein
LSQRFPAKPVRQEHAVPVTAGLLHTPPFKHFVAPVSAQPWTLIENFEK